MIKTFNFKMTLDGDEFTDGAINIDEKLLNIMSAEGWQRAFTTLKTEQDMVEYILEMMIINDFRLNEIDGFYGLSNDLVNIISNPEWKRHIWFEEIEEASD